MNNITSFYVKSITYICMCLKYVQNGHSGTFKYMIGFCSNFTVYFDKDFVFKKVLPCENTCSTFKTVSNTSL